MTHKLSFILGATEHAPMIFSRLDYCQVPQGFYGVGFQLLEYAAYDPVDIRQLNHILELRHRFYGKGVQSVDCGANVGVLTVEWGRLMRDWGNVLAFEAQERIYYALAGNVALNNLFNVKAVYAALSNKSGELMISSPDYNVAGSYGSFELKHSANNEYIGQPIDYAKKDFSVQLVTIDQFNLQRCDLIKIDVEGMESEVLEGAWKTIKSYKPVLWVEVLKSDQNAIVSLLQGAGYECCIFGMNLLAVHKEDKILPLLKGNENGKKTTKNHKSYLTRTSC
jgi:FkbM family methyltransferase